MGAANNSTKRVIVEESVYFVFVLTACDGYKAVYYRNEIFKIPVGNTIYVVKEKDGENISSITTSDIMTGRRYVLGLSTINIKRVL